MARTLKGTRARGLPPKVLLAQRQDATGSFPTVWRTSSDNRTGKYGVFFNDNKVVSFNQPVTDVGITADTYPQYEEKVITVGSVGTPATYKTVTFAYSFAGVPTTVITEITPNSNTPTVNAFITYITSTGMTVEFSAPFEGTFVYRAIYQTVAGTPKNVLRSPRFTDQYSLVVNQNNQFINSDNAYLSFSDFGSIPTNNYVTFYDSFGNNQADISGSATYVTNTSVQITGSSVAFANLYYMGFGDAATGGASILVNGIIQPLGMTYNEMLAGLSPEAIGDLYKQPRFSGSLIVNQPIVSSGSMRKGVADTFITFTPGQDIEPFMDFANPEVDGKISASIGGVNPFYATGSVVTVTGEGFQQPLWSKNKIEIDVTPSTEQTITLTNTGSSGNYPMSYWNPTTKQYEGIGSGRGILSGFEEVGLDIPVLDALLNDQTYGFGSSIDPGKTVNTNQLTKEETLLYGRQIDTFGFPYDGKFQPTSSQQILMSDYISEPFLLEKVVLCLSASYGYDGAYNTNSCIWTYFLINTRNNLPNQKIYNTVDWQVGYIATADQYQNLRLTSQTYLDLIDYMQVAYTGSFTSDLYGSQKIVATDRECVVEPQQLDTNPVVYSYNGQNFISSSVKNSISFQGLGFTSVSSAGTFPSMLITQSLSVSGRNQITPANGRDWKTSFEKPNVTGSVNPIPTIFNSTPLNSAYTKKNPYVLLPTDKLTFGVQMPWASTMVFNAPYEVTSSLGFATNGINKIILYGSTLRINPETNQLEEHHDTLNQLLSSNSIHEVIGE